jgi:hypothetical protein
VAVFRLYHRRAPRQFEVGAYRRRGKGHGFRYSLSNSPHQPK